MEGALLWPPPQHGHCRENSSCCAWTWHGASTAVPLCLLCDLPSKPSQALPVLLFWKLNKHGMQHRTVLITLLLLLLLLLVSKLAC